MNTWILIQGLGLLRWKDTLTGWSVVAGFGYTITSLTGLTPGSGVELALGVAVGVQVAVPVRVAVGVGVNVDVPVGVQVAVKV